MMLILLGIIEIIICVVSDISVTASFHRWARSGNSNVQRPEENVYSAAAWAVLLGIALGAIISQVWPARILQTVNLHGLSIPIVAIGTGFAMMKYGQWRKKAGVYTGFLATFWGGATFAASMAFTRWIYVAK